MCGGPSIRADCTNKCNWKDHFCLRGIIGASERTSLDLESDGHDPPQNRFYFPILSRYLSPGKMPEVSSEFIKGLVLEPVQSRKGCFRRVGVFDLGVETLSSQLRSCLRGLGGLKDIPHVAAHAMLFWIRRQSLDDIIRQGFSSARLDEEFYLDFDGVSQYTIEII